MGRLGPGGGPADFLYKHDLALAVEAVVTLVRIVQKIHVRLEIIRLGYVSVVNWHLIAINPSFSGFRVAFPGSAHALRIDIALGILPAFLEKEAGLRTVHARHIHGPAEAAVLDAGFIVLSLLEPVVIYK